MYILVIAVWLLMFAPAFAEDGKAYLDCYSVIAPAGGCPCRKPIDWRLTENRAMLLCNERSPRSDLLCDHAAYASRQPTDVEAPRSQPQAATST
jgi:hypothetical protein